MFLYEQYVKENTYSMSVSVHFKLPHIGHFRIATKKSKTNLLYHKFNSLKS